MDTSLSLSMKQQLRLNTQMLQSLELMTLPLAELTERINEEIEKNPVLAASESAESQNVSYEEYSSKIRKEESRGDNYSSDSYDPDSHNAWLEGAVAREETLTEHLEVQLGLSDAPDEVKAAAETIITSLGNDGFFTKPVEEVLPEKLLPYKDDALSLLHSFDPSGIACKDSMESLIIQAENLRLQDDELKIFKAMVKSYLPMLKDGKFKEVAKELNVDPEDIDALYSFLKTLTPYPASRFGSEYEAVIIPDLSIKKEEGKLVLRLNTSDIPVLSLDDSYVQMAQELSASSNQEEKEALKYLKKEIQNANTLINQVNLRAGTLEKVGKVLHQKLEAFFLLGFQNLKPLTLKQVADEINVHETTVSRITSGKYIDTDWGVLPLKTFFSSAIQTSHDEAGLSKNAVKAIIRQIIEENDSGKTLSDQKISDILNERGISCARRTVNKYRKELSQDPSFDR